jgi:superfamily II DNA/RNA helicase
VLALAEGAAGQDAKLRVLRRLVARTSERMIVFTEYRDTLLTLCSGLRGVATAVLHGGLDRAERNSVVRRFTSGCARVLLATDAAAHGLNLQFDCRLVVNLDLPWSPVRLEQRIGRVDRIGQTRSVHVIHLAARGTFEDVVLSRLALRVERVRKSVGTGSSVLGAMSEMEVAGEVFGDA